MRRGEFPRFKGLPRENRLQIAVCQTGVDEKLFVGTRGLRVTHLLRGPPGEMKGRKLNQSRWVILLEVW